MGALFGNVVIDTLDDLEWPERGWRLAFHGEWSLDGLGADLAYWRAAAEYRGSRLFGQRLVGQIDAQAGFSGDDLPVYDWYRLGGVTLLPGYRHEELKGAQSLAGSLSLRYRLLGQLRSRRARRSGQRVRPQRGHHARWAALGGRGGGLPPEPARPRLGRDGGARWRRDPC